VDTPAAKRDFSNVTYEEALRRARALVPFLKEQAPKNEALRRLTPEVMQALHESGLLRYLQPKRWGGMELPFISYFDIPEALARGDAATSWVVCNLAAHHRTLAWADPKAQEEIWGANPDVGIASGIAYHQGRAARVDGGLQCSGEWNFSSGTDHADWEQLAFTVREDDKPVDYVFCMIPRAEYEVVDDWHVLGMKATSSKTIRCKDVFVPQHRVISMVVKDGRNNWPGLAINKAPMFEIPVSAIGGNGLAGCLIGNARGALETTIEWVKSRSTNYTGAKMRDFQTVQLRIAAAAARIDAGAALIRNDVLEVQSIYERGEAIDLETRLRYKRNSAAGVRLAVEAVDSLQEMAGGMGIYDRSPLQRIFRDMRAGAGHFSFSVDAQLPPWGLVTLGGGFSSATM
jgi:3-hydroxy-9,10-secoandrosta-1,3,5(10)-triene-9,17-dione monooxygenase